MKIRLVLIISIILLADLPAQAEVDLSYQAPLLPAPPQSTIVETQDIQSQASAQDVNTEVIHYISPQPTNEILRFYQQFLKDTAWQVLTKVNKETYASLSLTGDNGAAANITVRKKRDGESDIYVVISQVQEETISVGKDPNWAPSYPGAIRRSYAEDKESGAVTVVYATDEPVEEIVKFYSEMMPNSGWWLKDKVTLDKIAGFGSGNYQNLVFSGWQGNCIVSVNRPKDMSKYGLADQNSTAVLLNFIPAR